jgi:hypothetical protein
MVSYKVAKNTWGNSCCVSATCADPGGGKVFACDLTTGNLKFLAHNGDKNIYSTSIINKGGKKVSVYHGILMTAIMDMPAHLTTMRGRGGFTATTQKLMDVFFQMVTSKANPQALQTLSHFYIAMAADKDDAAMKVSVGFPLATYSSGASKRSANDG